MTIMNKIIKLDSYKIILTQGEKNYKEIFDSIDRTSHLYITTFNYSMPEELEESLKEKIEFVNDVRVVFNVYNFDGKEEEKVYKLIVKALNKNPYVQFFYSSNNHSKIISTGNKMYIGSSNLTENATNNFEAGVIITDLDAIKNIEQLVFEYPHIKYKPVITDPIAPLIIPYQFFITEVQKEYNILKGMISSAKKSSFVFLDDEFPFEHFYDSRTFLRKYYQTFKLAKTELTKVVSLEDNGFMVENLFEDIHKELLKLCDYPPLGTSTANFFSFMEDYRNTLEEYKDHYWRTQTFQADTAVLEEELYVSRLKSLLDMFLHLRKTWIDLRGVKGHFFLDTQVPVLFWYEEPSMAEQYWRYFIK
ncbi:hypothetical protein ABD77_17895 [Brevibacillus formosus]|nr:hypothetical protein [Brevibacillus formosus]